MNRQAARIAELEGLAAELSEVLRAEGAGMAAETVAILRTVLATIVSGSATVRIISDTAALLRRQGRPRREWLVDGRGVRAAVEN